MFGFVWFLSYFNHFILKLELNLWIDWFRFIFFGLMTHTQFQPGSFKLSWSELWAWSSSAPACDYLMRMLCLQLSVVFVVLNCLPRIVVLCNFWAKHNTASQKLSIVFTVIGMSGRGRKDWLNIFTLHQYYWPCT